MKAIATIVAIIFIASCSTLQNSTHVPVIIYDTTYKKIYKDTTIYTKYYKDTTITRVIFKDSVVYNTRRADTTIYRYHYVDTTILIKHYKDTTIYNKKYVDTIIKRTVYKDTIIYNIIHKDSIVKRLVYVDSTVKVPKYVDTIIKRPKYVDSVIINYKDSCVQIPPNNNTTTFGMMQAQDVLSQTEASMKYAGIKIVRAVVYFSNTTSSSVVDKYLSDGFKVQINFNWKPTGSPVPFPSDTAMIASKADAFFKHYLPYKNQIPFVSVENEWDNPNYHTGNIQDYLNELAIAIRIGHKYGFKIADAGITGTALTRWTYSKLSGDSATWWKGHYFVGLNNDYNGFVSMVNTYLAGISKLALDFINFHWYNNNGCFGGPSIALYHIIKASKNFAIVSNEWGVMDAKYWTCTIGEIKKIKPVYAVVYSGVNSPGNAIRLSDDQLKQML